MCEIPDIYAVFCILVDLSKPWRDVSPSVTGDVLVALATAREPLSGLEVADRAGRGTSAVASSLRDLAESGLIRSRRAGRATLHELERDHVLAPAVETMAEARAELYRRITDLIGEWERQPLNDTVFGSTASGSGSSASDIDILVLHAATGTDDEWTGQLGALSSAVNRWSGNRADVLDYTMDAFEALAATGSPFPREVASGRTVAGEPLHRLLARRRRRS